MNVLFVPDWRIGGNPYQSLLLSALDKNKVVTSIDDYKKGGFVLLKTVRAHPEIEIVHIHWIDHYLSWFFTSISPTKRSIKYLMYILDLMLVKLMGKKIVWTVHNKFMHESLSIAWERKFRRLIARFADQVILHSPSAVNEISEAWGVKINGKATVIPHGHYLDVYKNDISKLIARKQIGLKENDIVFLYFGNIRPYKGVYKLIEAFKTNKKLKKAKLLLVGKPRTQEDRKTITNYIKGEKNIVPVLEFIDEGDIQLYMNAADVVVFPFENILSSGSVILAMSFGKAVITPREGCLVDILDEKGALFYDKYHLSLHQVLEQSLDSNFNAMGRHNKKSIEQYDWNDIGKQLKKVYSKVLNNGK